MPLVSACQLQRLFVTVCLLVTTAGRPVSLVGHVYTASCPAVLSLSDCFSTAASLCTTLAPTQTFTALLDLNCKLQYTMSEVTSNVSVTTEFVVNRTCLAGRVIWVEPIYLCDLPPFQQCLNASAFLSERLQCTVAPLSLNACTFVWATASHAVKNGSYQRLNDTEK